MAKNGNGGSKWGSMRPGRRSIANFSRLVSPLGEDGAETPVYSPSRPVSGAKGQPQGQASQTESARNARRGD
jgi:hypothetical protein